MTHLIYSKLKNNEEVIGVYLDISKAFDKVWHQGLIYKLKKAGIRGNLLNWLISYLSQRSQRVTIGGAYSDWSYLEAGVPQGSILGPLLFLVFINDIAVGTTSIPHLFADDSNLLLPTKNVVQGVEVINDDLAIINSWCNRWCVTMNATKIKAILYSRKREPSTLEGLIFNNTTIEVHSSVKHLGIMFDSKLSWDVHTNDLIKRANNATYPIHLLKYKISTQNLLLYYKSFIRPIIEYGNIIWGNCGTTVFIKLDRIQYRLALSITGAMSGSSRVKLNDVLGIPSLEERCNLMTVCTIQKMYFGNVPNYLSDLIDIYKPLNNYNLRDPYKLMPSGQLYSSCIEKGIKLWNLLPIEIRRINLSSKIFKLRVLNHWQISTKFKFPLKTLDRRHEILINRFLVDFSQLKDDLFKHNIIPDNKCSCGMIENLKHYLFECPQYTNIRQTLMRNLVHLEIFTNENIQLSSRELFIIFSNLWKNVDLPQRSALLLEIQNYIRTTNRFYIDIRH